MWGGKEMRKGKTFRRIAAGFLAAGLVISQAPVTFAAEVSKQESVYVTANADGSVKTVTVSDQLKGAEGITGTIKDVSDLTEIKNVKGDETFDQSGNNLTWNAAGADIYYQGKTTKELPVSIKLEYELDGVKAAPEELVGKSGKMKITLSYENRSYITEDIKGKTEKIATPFLMATGFILDSETFSNIEISDGGKVIDDGSKSIVIFVGLPGLKDSLSLTGKMKDKIEDKLKESFTIESDVTNFAMKNTFTFASPNLMNGIISDEDNKKMFSFGEIDDKLDDLTKAVDKIGDGTGKLKKGAKKLDKGTSKLVDGLKKYADTGVKELIKGINTLCSNGPALKKGVGKYINGVDKFADGTKAYVEGAGQLTSGISMLTSGLAGADASKVGQLVTGVTLFSQAIASATNKDDMEKLSGGAKAVSEGVGTLNTGLTSLKDSYSNEDTAITGLETALATNQKVLEGLKTAKAAGATGLDEAIAALEQTTKGERAAIDGLKQVEAGQKDAIDKMVSSTSSTGALGAGASQVSTGVGTLTEGLTKLGSNDTVTQLKEAVGGIAEKLPALMLGVKKLGEGAAKLAANDKTLIKGATDLKNAGKTMRSSVDKLSEGMDQLASGAGKLGVATDELVKGAGKLGSGTGTLAKGLDTLDSGFDKFRKKAIDKLLDVYHNDIKSLVDRLDALVDAGKEYTSFSGIPDGMDGEVKFIIETESVKADEE